MTLKKLLLIIICIINFSILLKAQETTATFSGTVSDERGGIIPGATIQLVHVPTGTIIATQSNKKGIFNLNNLKPGGPYTFTISFVGFREEKAQDLNLQLGNNPELNITLKQSTSNLEAVVITTSKRLNNIGITRAQMNVLPTISRSLSDITRLTPQSNNNSFAGSNFRYNNLTIDGAINNDAIGFSNSFGGTSGGGQSGAAGAGTRTNPYSIDVIQEVQVQLAPFDVKLGNFTGGSVNAVTKSGTNDFHGSVYAYGRNQSLFGKSVDGLNTSIGKDFYDYQYGATASGAIKKNKAFYIINFEQTRRQEPTFYNVGDPGSAIKSVAEAESIVNKLKSIGYDPGSYMGAYNLFTNSDKLFARFDFKLDNKSSLMLRGIYTNGWGNNLERSSTNFQFGNTDFTQHTNNINLVAELKTKFSNNISNQLNVSYINVHEYRTFPGTLAPFIDIDNGRIWAGTWREASIYNMKQKTIEISDNLNITKDNHKITLGTHNEFYNLGYGFVNSWNGRWEYSGGVESFLNNNPSRVRGAFITDPKLTNDRNAIYNNPPNPFNVALLSAYAQDEILVSKKLKLTAGFRLDYAAVGNQPGVDAGLNATNNNANGLPAYVSSNPTYTNTAFSQLKNNYLGNMSISPRVSFNYKIKNNGSIVLRGGAGIFVGRVPFAWMGYGYTLNGNTYGNIDWNGPAAGQNVPLAMNPNSLRDTVTKYGGALQSSTRELDIVDNNFKLPRVLRANLAVDFKLGKGFKFGLDVLYTKTLYDIQFKQINLRDSVAYYTSGPTQTPYYISSATNKRKYNSEYSNVYLLTNTTEGYRYNITAQISNTSKDISIGNKSLDLNSSLAYTYGYSKDVSNGIRNSWESNFNLNPSINPNNTQMSFSNFDLRHRIVASLSGTFNWSKVNATSLTFFYSGQSGNPYSLVYQSAPFGNGSNASLPYIPKNQSDINLMDQKNAQGIIVYSASQQWNDLSSFINSEDYLQTRKGQYAERNGLRTPWVHQLDMKLMHEIKLSKTNKLKTLQLSIDIFNVLNLLNNDWGHVNFVSNVNNYSVNFLKFVKDASGVNPGAPLKADGTTVNYTPSFNFVKPSGIQNQYYTLDPINSRWQGQVGIKYNF